MIGSLKLHNMCGIQRVQLWQFFWIIPRTNSRVSKWIVSGSAYYPPLALICSLLGLLQLGQSCGQTLLSTVQLLLNQLDASVQGSYIALSLGRPQQHNPTESNQVQSYSLKTTYTVASAGLCRATASQAAPADSLRSLGWVRNTPMGERWRLYCAHYLLSLCR